ncbi:MAG: peptidase [Candidatus Saccharibacteria bacterium]|jgi:succinyl-diaminopimelate desuccinylase|nr:peptidase [Candidatus Saccharibacteria bacterium]
MPSITTNTTQTLVELLSHLVRFPTVTSDHATNSAALDWVEEQLSGLPLHIRRYQSKGHPSLVATTRDTKSPKLWLAGHIDVVPGPSESYEPKVAGGRLYGRGAHDMKFALATFIALLQELGDSLAELDLGLMISSDEEVGGFNGVGYLVETLGYRGQTVFLPDTNSDWKFEMGAKGVMWWDVTAKGVASHAGRAWQGVNAIDELIRFVDHVRANFQTEPCHDPDHPHATFNLGTISGGTAANAVPDSASARIDIRYPAEVSADVIAFWFEAAHAAVPTVEAKLAITDTPYLVPNDGPIHHFERIAEAVTGRKLGRFVAHGSSDARFFARHGGHSVNICPTGSGFHMPTEWIDIADLTRFYEVTRQFVQDWARA